MLKLKCRILTPGLRLELVTLADGLRLETLALRKELGSGSDVTGSARCWNRFMNELQFYGEEWTDVNADGGNS
ncbi:Taste Receptor Type 2 Member 39 [Manis pentadactyla]|nr:Taste Receptor Type 2 Member 39 [Manis pentadactyla]